MNEFKAIPRDEGRGGSIMALFLGFYLLVLAFFILLVTISTREDVKANDVMDCLSATFSTILPLNTFPTAFTAREDSIQAGQEYQERVTRLFATTLQVAKIEYAQPGRLMRVQWPSDSLFFSGETQIRESRYPLLDFMVAALSGRPPGMHYNMECVIGIANGDDGILPVRQTLEMARAGTFSRKMQSRGAPPWTSGVTWLAPFCTASLPTVPNTCPRPRHLSTNSISMGVRPWDSADAVIWFHVRILDEIRINFRDTVSNG